MISISQPSWIETVSADSCSRQMHRSQHNHGLKCQVEHGQVIGHIMESDIPSICGTHQNTSIGGGEMLNELVSAMSKRAGNNDNEHVSAKSKPARGLRLLKRNDAPEAMKDDGRNEDNPDNTGW